MHMCKSLPAYPSFCQSKFQKYIAFLPPHLWLARDIAAGSGVKIVVLHVESQEGLWFATNEAHELFEQGRVLFGGTNFERFLGFRRFVHFHVLLTLPGLGTGRMPIASHPIVKPH